MEKNITIYSDEDGFTLLQCHLCGEYFKLPTCTVNDEITVNIWCPYCGLNGKNYTTSEMLDVGMRIAENEMNEMIYKMFKDFERKIRGNNFMTFKADKKTESRVIIPIKERVNNLDIKELKCCHTRVKIKPVTKMCGYYCPICGGINYE